MNDIVPADAAMGSDLLLEIRGQHVVLDSDLAKAFGTETKRINEAVSRNTRKFNENHCFQLTKRENEFLKSQAATSKPGRGGRRTLPWVFTQKGIARVAMILDTDEALAASDVIIDTFISVLRQLSISRDGHAAGRQNHLRATTDEVDGFRKRLLAAMSSLLDTVIDTREEATIGDVLRGTGLGVLDNIKDRLQQKGLENEKLMADTILLLAKAEETRAAVLEKHVDIDGKKLANLSTRIDIVQKMIEFSREIEPDKVIRLMSDFETETPKLIDAEKREAG